MRWFSSAPFSGSRPLSRARKTSARSSGQFPCAHENRNGEGVDTHAAGGRDGPPARTQLLSRQAEIEVPEEVFTILSSSSAGTWFCVDPEQTPTQQLEAPER